MNVKKLIKYIIATVAVGSLPALFINFKDTYNSFIKPPLSPPGIAFPIVWTILYILMAISLYRVSENDSSTDIKSIYYLQLFFNVLWTPLFFDLKLYIFSFIWLLILLVIVIIMTIKYYHVDKVSAFLLIPYILWLLFAGYLNLTIAILN